MTTTVVNQSRSGNKITYQSSSASDVDASIEILSIENGRNSWFVGVDYFSDSDLTIPLNNNGENAGIVSVFFITQETLSEITVGDIDVSLEENRRILFSGNPLQIIVSPNEIPSGSFVRIRATAVVTSIASPSMPVIFGQGAEYHQDLSSVSTASSTLVTVKTWNVPEKAAGNYLLWVYFNWVTLSTTIKTNFQIDVDSVAANTENEIIQATGGSSLYPQSHMLLLDWTAGDSTHTIEQKLSISAFAPMQLSDWQLFLMRIS